MHDGVTFVFCANVLYVHQFFFFFFKILRPPPISPLFPPPPLSRSCRPPGAPPRTRPSAPARRVATGRATRRARRAARARSADEGAGQPRIASQPPVRPCQLDSVYTLKPRIRPRARAAPAERRRVRARVRRLEALVLRTHCRRAVTSRPQPRAASMRHRAMHPGHHQAAGPAEIAAVPWRQAGRCVAACALALLAAAYARRAQGPGPVPATAAAPASAPAPATPPAPPPAALARWLNPATAPFIPISGSETAPHNGLTLGLLPTLLHTNSREIGRASCRERV